MKRETTDRLLLACAICLAFSPAGASTGEMDAGDVLTPSNADLVVVTPSCTLWATTTRNVGTREQMISHAWRFWKTTYHVVGRGFTNHYSTVEPFHDRSSVTVSSGGSVFVGNALLLLSERDASTSTNGFWLQRLRFQADNRDFSGWTFEIESPGSADAAVKPAPARFLRVTTSRKTGCRIPLYDYAVTNVSTVWRRDDWSKTWPVLNVGYWKDRMVIWNGLGWQEVLLNSLTKVIACIAIDYRYEDGNNFVRWWRLNYSLEDDGSRGVSKHIMHTDTMVAGDVHPAPAIPTLDAAGVHEVEELVKTLPPSTGEGLTNWMVRVTDGGDPRIARTYIRSYPCAAVPAKVMRLIELMGGLQYEAKEILKPEVLKVERE